MKKIILDTDFLIHCATAKIDYVVEIRKILDFKYELFIIDKTIDELDSLIERKKGKVKAARMYGGSCDASLFYVNGYRAAGICIPLIAWHNNGELEGKKTPILEACHVDDFMSGVAFIAQISKTLSKTPGIYKTIGTVSFALIYVMSCVDQLFPKQFIVEV